MDKGIDVNKDIRKTQHFTINSTMMLEGLVESLGINFNIDTIIEPFYGDGDLIKGLSAKNIIKYDIDPRYDDVVYRDTLKNPPKYDDVYVITNPPYLARNKADNKSIYDMYELDDMYKIAIKTMLNAKGGILVIPTNFFMDERSNKIRIEFLNKYYIKRINIFNNKVFDSTSYNVCAFSFIKKDKDNDENQSIKIKIYPESVDMNMVVDRKSNYRFGGKDLENSIDGIKNSDVIFSRLLEERKDDYFKTNIVLETIDTRNERFGLRLVSDGDIIKGKVSDRVKVSITCKENISLDKQLILVNRVNKQLNDLRNKNNNLIFSMYRDGNRRKVSFGYMYKLLTKVYVSI